MDVQLHQCEVVDLIDTGRAFQLITAPTAPGCLLVTDVLLVTGQSAGQEGAWAPRHSVKGPVRRRTICVGDPYPLPQALPVTMPVAGLTVGCLGANLTAVDVISHLTEGRGGEFIAGPAGDVAYLRSGYEPARIVVLSRSGLMGLAKPAKAPMQDAVPTAFLRVEELEAMREAIGAPAWRNRGRRQLDWERDLLPVVVLEMAYSYYRTLFGPEFAKRFVAIATPRWAQFLQGERAASHPTWLLEPTGPYTDAVAEEIEHLLTGLKSIEELLGSSLHYAATAAKRYCRVVYGLDIEAQTGHLACQVEMSPLWHLGSGTRSNLFRWR